MRAIVKDCKKVRTRHVKAFFFETLILFANQISDSCAVVSVCNPLPSLLLSDVLSQGSAVGAEVDAGKRRLGRAICLAGR